MEEVYNIHIISFQNGSANQGREGLTVYGGTPSFIWNITIKDAEKEAAIKLNKYCRIAFLEDPDGELSKHDEWKQRVTRESKGLFYYVTGNTKNLNLEHIGKGSMKGIGKEEKKGGNEYDSLYLLKIVKGSVTAIKREESIGLRANTKRSSKVRVSVKGISGYEFIESRLKEKKVYVGLLSTEFKDMEVSADIYSVKVDLPNLEVYYIGKGTAKIMLPDKVEDIEKALKS